MSLPLRFGIVMLPNQPYPQLVEHCLCVEALGFDSVWVGDHFVDPYVPAGYWLEAWTLLAALAAETRYIRLGALVSSITLRSPAMLARQAVVVDRVSNGRLELGIGAGRAPLDGSMTGVPQWSDAERARRFHEYVVIVEQLLRNVKTTHEGRYYHVEEALMNPLPLQQPRPPLTLAAHGPVTLKIAARYADTWNSFGKLHASTDVSTALTRERNRMLNDFCAARGRDPKTLRRSFLAGLTNDKPFISLQAFHDFIGEYREAGINEFIFYWLPEGGHPVMRDRGASGACLTSRAMLERIATEALPALRAAG